jgi:hypothetical protein
MHGETSVEQQHDSKLLAARACRRLDDRQPRVDELRERDLVAAELELELCRKNQTVS